MTRWLRSRWFLAVVAVGLLFGGWPLVKALAQLASATPAAPAPIVLSYRDGPIFLGPHEMAVSSIAFSPDGKRLVTGSMDGFLRVWDSATGELLSIHAEDATRGLHSIAFAPDGRTVAAAGGIFGKDAVIWDIESGKIVREFDDPRELTSAKLSGAEAGRAAVKSPGEAQMIYKGKPINYRVLNAVAYSPDGKLLATGGDGVVLRDVETGKVIASLAQPAKGVRALAFFPDGKLLATASEDRKVRLWSVPAGKLEATLDGATQPLASLSVSSDGSQVVATGSGDRSFLSRGKPPVGFLWAWHRSGDAQDRGAGFGPTPRRFDLGEVNARQVAFVDSATVLVAAGRDLISLDPHGNAAAQSQRISSQSADIHAVAISPDGRLIVTGGADRTADVIERTSGQLVYRLPGLNDIVSALALSDNDKLLATATIDLRFSDFRIPDATGPFAERYAKYFGDENNASRMQPSEVRIWSLETGRLARQLSLPLCQVTSLANLPKRDQLAVAGWVPKQGGMLALWDYASGKEVRKFEVSGPEIRAVAASPDGQSLISGDADGNLRFWNVETGKQQRSLKQDHAIEAIAFSGDGKLVAVADANRTVRFYDPASGKVVRTLASREGIETLEFSPDGHYLAAGTTTPGMELWDLRSDDASVTLLAAGDHFDKMPGFVAFSKDGRFVCCAGHGKDIALFDVATKKLHCELSGHYHVATAAVFLSDGRLISGAEERTVRLWDVDRRKLAVTWLSMPADTARRWEDAWVGFTPTGEFVSSDSRERLVGWETGGNFLGPEEGNRHLVPSLFGEGVKPVPE